jgi:hypothetical protein
MENLSIIGFIFLTLSFLGFYLAYLYGKETKKFQWSEYAALLLIPVCGVIYLSYYINLKIALFFLLSACTGVFFEYVIGLSYHKALNRRLWNYERLDIHGYTSVLALPLWGIVGVWFWFLSEMIGL